MNGTETGASPTLLKRMRTHAHRGRGAVYKWLLKNHSKVQSGFEKTEATWDSVVDAMIADKVTGREGTPPNKKSVARVWVRVCRDVEAARRTSATRSEPSHRSRRESDWRPTEGAVPPHRGHEPTVHAREPPPATSSPLPPSKAGNTDTDDDLSPEAKAKFARLRAQFAETDRKRFGSF